MAKVTDKVIKFLFDEIFLVEDSDSLGAYYILGADGVDDSLENFLKKNYDPSKIQFLTEK